MSLPAGAVRWLLARDSHVRLLSGGKPARVVSPLPSMLSHSRVGKAGRLLAFSSLLKPRSRYLCPAALLAAVEDAFIMHQWDVTIITTSF